jgi:hypothetical protein
MPQPRRMGSGCADPRFLDLGTSLRWVVSFTPRPLYPRGKRHPYPLDRRLIIIKIIYSHYEDSYSCQYWWHYCNDLRGQVDDAPASYFRGRGFQPGREDRLSWLSPFLISLTSSRQIRRLTFPSTTSSVQYSLTKTPFSTRQFQILTASSYEPQIVINNNNNNNNSTYRILITHSVNYDHFCLLGCDAI